MNGWLARAERFLRLAERLLEEGEPETALSRVYYAAFYIAQVLLESRDLRYSSHGALIAAYGKEFAKNEVLDPRFHRVLREAFAARQAVDYTLTASPSRAEIQRMLEDVQAFLRAARAYLEP